MRVGIFSGEAVADAAALLARVLASPADGGRRPEPPRSRPRRRTSSRRSAPKRFTVAAVDLGIKGMTPHRMAERGIEVHVLPATATVDDSTR